MQKFGWIVGGLVLVAVVVLIVTGQGWFSNELPKRTAEIGKPTPTEKTTDPNSVGHKPLLDALGVADDEMVEVGGIKRPKRDIVGTNGDSRELASDQLPNPGNSKFLTGDEHPQVAALLKELQKPNGSAASRSTFVPPEPFDREKFKKDPELYLSQIRPARVFYPAQPGPDVQRLVSKSKPFQSVLQGESVVLKVEAEIGMPVTFYTPEVGYFENRLKTISTIADENGIATAVYKAGPGTQGIMNILAASPVHSGQLRFRVDVELPKQ